MLFRCLVAITLATVPSGPAAAHADWSGYATCAQTFAVPPAIPSDETSPPGIGVRNICDYSVVGVVCVQDRYGKWHRWATPVNLQAGADHSWTVHQPEN